MGRIRFDRLEFALDGVEVSRRALFREREVELVDIDRGTVTAVLGLGPVAEALGRSVPEGEVTARVVGRSLRVSAGEFSFDVPLPQLALMPCEGGARVTGEEITITCTVTDLPPALVRVVAEVSR